MLDWVVWLIAFAYFREDLWWIIYVLCYGLWRFRVESCELFGVLIWLSFLFIFDVLFDDVLDEDRFCWVCEMMSLGLLLDGY